MKSNELKKAMSERGNDLRAKNEEATKPETNTLPSNPDVKESELMQELLTEMKKEIGGKHNTAGKPTAALKSSLLDNEKSKELKMVVSEQENELQAEIEVVVGEKDENAGKQKAELTPSVQDDEKMR